MAVINAYKLSTSIKTQVKGGQVIAVAGNFETVATDGAGSKYRLCRVGADYVPIELWLNNDAIAGTDDVDLGLYTVLEDGGAAKDADCFVDGADISAGKAIGSEQNGLASLPLDEVGDTMSEQAGDTNQTPGMEYDLVLTSNNAVTGAGTVAFRGLFAKAA